MKWFPWLKKRDKIGELREELRKELKEELKNELKELTTSIENTLNEDEDETSEKIKTLIGISKQLTNILLQVVSENEMDEIQKVKERRNKDLKVINNNFDIVNKKIKGMKNQQRDLLSVLSKSSIETETIDIFSRELNLRKILERKDINQASLLGILYLAKRMVEEKGLKV